MNNSLSSPLISGLIPGIKHRERRNNNNKLALKKKYKIELKRKIKSIQLFKPFNDKSRNQPRLLKENVSLCNLKLKPKKNNNLERIN